MIREAENKVSNTKFIAANDHGCLQQDGCHVPAAATAAAASTTTF
jgi:hypothetical protein